MPQDAHRESCLHHVALLDESGRVGDGVWRGEIGSDMAQLADTATPMRDGRGAADGVELVAHAGAYHREDRDEQGGGGGVGDEVTQDESIPVRIQS